MDNVTDLRKRILSIQPAHDTPFGRIHPYWARKPLNVVREIIKATSNMGDLVCDPFMGSGTTVFGSLLEGRSVIAGDINPLASMIVQGTLDLCQYPQQKIEALSKFIEDFQEKVLPWYIFDSSGDIVERERYSVDGIFEDGDFQLIPEEIVIKLRNGNKFGRRKVVRLERHLNNILQNEIEGLASSPIDFRRCRLTANSRIAIPKGALLSHYFTKINMACINYAIRLIDNYQYDHQTKILLKFFLSSSLPLLRLSDYKASSQWPYWRPKKRLTSRNPILVFKRRFGEFKRAQKWLLDNMPTFSLDTSRTFRKDENLKASVDKLSIQKLRSCFYPGDSRKADLILSDPPYGDHVPYLEYSSLWTHALGLPVSEEDFENEIVKTDATGRHLHTSLYLPKLLLGFEICTEILKDQGYLVWFYQDSDLRNWAAIYNKSKMLGLRFVAVIPVPKQRRSMKTVTTPGKTFDGDLIIIFQKNGFDSTLKTYNNEILNNIMDRTLKDINTSDSSFFFRYAYLMQASFEQGWINLLSEKCSDIRDVIK